MAELPRKGKSFWNVITDPKGTVLVECGHLLARGRPLRNSEGKIVYQRDGKNGLKKDKKPDDSSKTSSAASQAAVSAKQNQNPNTGAGSITLPMAVISGMLMTVLRRKNKPDK